MSYHWRIREQSGVIIKENINFNERMRHEQGSLCVENKKFSLAIAAITVDVKWTLFNAVEAFSCL